MANQPASRLEVALRGDGEDIRPWMARVLARANSFVNRKIKTGIQCRFDKFAVQQRAGGNAEGGEHWMSEEGALRLIAYGN